MGSSFKGVDLFGSGPHRFASGREGEQIVASYLLGGSDAGGVAIGLVDVEVRVRGRLVAASESGLWARRDALTSMIEHPPEPGTLIDSRGRSWEDMSLVGFVPEDRTDRGRVFSLGYECIFRRLP